MIIPCYNHAQYLPDAVRSIISQTVSEWECIIINDGSSDNTRDVALSLAAEDSRVRYLEQPNRGLARARNRGLDEARGQYIQFLDADDIIAPNKFELQLQALSTTNELALSYSNYYCCRINDRLNIRIKCYLSPQIDIERPLQDLASRWETELSIPVHCFLLDARIFKLYQIRFDESIPNHEDWECWMRVLTMKPSLFYVDEELAVYRILDSSMHSNYARMRRGFLQAIRKQQKLWRKNREMREILELKIEVTKGMYKRLMERRRRRARYELYRRLQRVIPSNTRESLKLLLRRMQ